MGTRSWELVTADEPTVIAKPLLYVIVVEDGQGDGGFPDATCTDESGWGEGFCETNDLPDQLFTPETGPRWRGR
jgi:hypothetical protein